METKQPDEQATPKDTATVLPTDPDVFLAIIKWRTTAEVLLMELEEDRDSAFQKLCMELQGDLAKWWSWRKQNQQLSPVELPERMRFDGSGSAAIYTAQQLRLARELNAEMLAGLQRAERFVSELTDDALMHDAEPSEPEAKDLLRQYRASVCDHLRQLIGKANKNKVGP